MRLWKPMLLLGLMVALLPSAGRSQTTKVATSKPATAERIATPSAKKLMLWELKGKTNTVYMFGSIHLGNASFYPLHPVIEKAFQRSQQLSIEVDESKHKKPMEDFVKKHGIYSGRRSLKDDLSKAGMAKFDAFIMNHMMGMGMILKRMRPWMIAVTIVTVQLQRLGYSAWYGLDDHFIRKAKSRKIGGKFMPILEMETAEYQLKMLSNFKKEVLEEYLMSTLTPIGELKKSFEAIVKHWKAGDTKAFAKEALSQLAKLKSGPILYDRIFAQRNAGMASKIEGYLKSGVKTFAIAGAGHFVGKRNIIELLRAKGYKVRQCTTDHFKQKASSRPVKK